MGEPALNHDPMAISEKVRGRHVQDTAWGVLNADQTALLKAGCCPFWERLLQPERDLDNDEGSDA
jgi:hypothetical protein